MPDPDSRPTDYAWLEFLRDYRAEHPELTFAEAKAAARHLYEKARGQSMSPDVESRETLRLSPRELATKLRAYLLAADRSIDGEGNAQ